jgi:hypothetical protein
VKTIIVIFLSIVSCVQAAKYSGYSRGKKIEQMTEYIEDIRESKKKILVAFSNHDAFYVFPKATYSADVKDFLRKRKKERKKLIVHYEFNTGNIISFEDVK